MAPHLRGAAEWPCGHSRETLTDSNNGRTTALHPNEDRVARSHRVSQDGLRLLSSVGRSLLLLARVPRNSLEPGSCLYQVAASGSQSQEACSNTLLLFSLVSSW